MLKIMVRNCITCIRQDRLIQKTKQIFDKISRPVLTKKQLSAEVKVNPEKENLKLVRTVDIARARGFDLKILFSYEITSTSLFLSLPDGTLRTPTSKSNLLKEVRVMPTLNLVQQSSPTVVFVDFMAHARKVRGRRNKLLIRTFGDWVENLLETFISLNVKADTIHIVFDLYLKNCRKDGDQKRRGNADSIKIDIAIFHEVGNE